MRKQNVEPRFLQRIHAREADAQVRRQQEKDRLALMILDLAAASLRHMSTASEHARARYRRRPSDFFSRLGNFLFD